MQRIFTIFLLCLNLFSLAGQTTIKKNGKEFFNGDDRHLRVYLNNNYDRLDPIEGIWIFTRIEYNTWGVEVSRTPNEITAAVVRDPDNLRRAFVEVNMSRAFCKDYQITYSVQTGGGSGYYPCEPEGCGVLSGQYHFDYQQKTLSRPAISLMGNQAVLVGIKTFPQGPPTRMLPEVGGATPTANGQVTKRQPHIITHPSGWEPHIDWDNQIFSSYVLSMADANPKNFPIAADYKGDPISVVGIVVNTPKVNSEIEIEVESTPYSKATRQTYNLEKRGTQYAIYPKVSWDYRALRCLTQAVPLDITFKVSINGKQPVIQTVTANLRAIDDCPLEGYDYRGEKIDLKFMASAYVNEGSPIIPALMSEIRKKGLVRDFVGLQAGEEVAIQQVYAFWKLLRDKGISYSSITNNGQKSRYVNSQRIRLLEDVIDQTQANCVDGTALFASCLSAIKIPPIMVFVPGHAFLGYTSKNIKGDDGKVQPNNYFLETTMLGGAVDERLPDFKELLKLERYSVIRESLRKKFYDGSQKSAQEIDYFICASMVGDKKVVEEITNNPEAVMAININEARQYLFVKPLFRCEGTTSVIPSREVNPANPKSIDIGKGKEEPKYGNDETPNQPKRTLIEKRLRKGTQDYDSLEFLTEASDTEKDVFRVQVENCAIFDANKKEYQQLAEFGKFYPEYFTQKDRYRVMLGDFTSRIAAHKAAKKAQSLGFENVAIVRYQKGNRYEHIYRDWKLLPD